MRGRAESRLSSTRETRSAEQSYKGAGFLSAKSVLVGQFLPWDAGAPDLSGQLVYRPTAKVPSVPLFPLPRLKSPWYVEIAGLFPAVQPKENRMTTPKTLHPDFPTEILGAIGGAQEKVLLCRGEDGKYQSPQRSAEEVQHRFEQAGEVVGWLVEYFHRKKSEFPEWTDEKNLERIRLALIQKAEQGKWAFTPAEQAWIMDRLRERTRQST